MNYIKYMSRWYCMSGTVKRFEDLRAWQRSREITQHMYALTGRECFRKDPALRDQMRRASTSIMLNIAEGFKRGTDKEFRLHLIHARGSTTEVQSALYVALDVGYVESNEFKMMYDMLDILTGMLTTLVNYLDGYKVRRNETQLTALGLTDPRPQIPDTRTRGEASP